MKSYLIMMAVRLLEMKRILKPTGSIYLHCDPTASHYLKSLMDSLFGAANFRNEIIWKRTGSHGGSRRYGPIHDVILFYSATQDYEWNRVYQDYSSEYLENYYRYEDERGRFRLVTLTGSGTRYGDSGLEWRGVNPTDSGRHWAVPRQAIEEAYPDRDDLSDLTVQERLDLLDSLLDWSIGHPTAECRAKNGMWTWVREYQPKTSSRMYERLGRAQKNVLAIPRKSRWRCLNA